MKKPYTRLIMVVTAMFMASFFVTAQTTVHVKIARGLDDVEEVQTMLAADRTQGDVYSNSSDLELLFDHEPQFIGLMFRGLQIPAGSAIVKAYVQFQVDEIVAGTTDAPMTVDVYAAKEVNAADLSETDFSVSSRTMTTAKVTWIPGPSIAIGDRTANEQTTDIAPVIQELVDQPGWAGGNNILIVLSGDSANTQDVNREMESFEGDTAGAPELFVTYIEGTGIESKKEFTCSVYPNPTEGQVCIDNPSDRNFSYEIFNINGQLVSSGHSLSGSSVEIDMSAFAKGTYIVDVESAERIETHKLILK